MESELMMNKEIFITNYEIISLRDEGLAEVSARIYPTIQESDGDESVLTGITVQLGDRVLNIFPGMSRIRIKMTMKTKVKYLRSGKEDESEESVEKELTKPALKFSHLAPLLSPRNVPGEEENVKIKYTVHFTQI